MLLPGFSTKINFVFARGVLAAKTVDQVLAQFLQTKSSFLLKEKKQEIYKVGKKKEVEKIEWLIGEFNLAMMRSQDSKYMDKKARYDRLAKAYTNQEAGIREEMVIEAKKELKAEVHLYVCFSFLISCFIMLVG